MDERVDQPQSPPTASTIEGEHDKTGVQLDVESFRSVRIEMVFSPHGRDTQTLSQCKTMAHGTAFVYRLDGRDYLVTARHNLTGRHWQTNESISSSFNINPTHLRVTLFAAPPEKWMISPLDGDSWSTKLQVPVNRYLLPLIGEDWQPIWKQHPTLGVDMDVAALDYDAPNNAIVEKWERTGDRTLPELVPWPRLSPGQDVFIVGYPYRLSVGPRLPLWIRGTVASDPAFAYDFDDKLYPLWLIDARTRPGQSGAPVMRYRPPGWFGIRNDGNPGTLSRSDADLVGVYSGRTSKDSDLGFVWSMNEVDKICRNGKPGRV